MREFVITKHFKSVGLAVAALIFTGWASALVYESSFIAIDGQRHYCLFDDAMISMRYAWNLVNDHGLVWNPPMCKPRNGDGTT